MATSAGGAGGGSTLKEVVLRRVGETAAEHGDGRAGRVALRVFERPGKECKVTLLVVHHRVRDFDSWKPVFDENEPLHRDHGAQRHWVYRTADDPNDVVVALEFSSREQASAFLEDPSLREAMRRAGVEGEPQIHFRELVETVEY